MKTRLVLNANPISRIAFTGYMFIKNNLVRLKSQVGHPDNIIFLVINAFFFIVTVLTPVPRPEPPSVDDHTLNINVDLAKIL